MNRLDPTVLEDRITRFDFSHEVAEKIRRGGRCFIVGMGPSISKIDPSALKDELVIGVNHVLRTKFIPDIICVSDASRLDTDNLSETTPKLITASHVYRKNAEFLDTVNHYHEIDFVSLRHSVLSINAFDANLEKIYWTASVIGDLAIPLAAYLGLSQAYVVGLDGVRASFPVSHAWGKETHITGPHDAKIFHLHEKAAFLAKASGLDVYNASFGGVVEAFEKVSLSDILPEAVKTIPEGEVSGKYIVFNGTVLTIVPCEDDDAHYQLKTLDGIRCIRLTKGRVVLDKNDGSEQFLQDSKLQIEPSFVRSDWVCLRALAPSNFYVARWDENSGYILREAKDAFSPYFSSFRLFDSPDKAQSRIDTDKILASLAQIRTAVGNLMIKNDSD